ncbi:MAG: LysR family transcriptional regulator substrate-binding protein, partial [Christensenellaceae bacterium]|nr:LysR family transcriptional regulator substrate-binding protein [Christensenellaceae bacterium]
EEMINCRYVNFHNKYPSISVKFTTADTLVMFDMLDHNEADLIITLDSHSYNKDYIIAKEEQLPMHFVANANSKFADTANLSVHNIINEPFILTEYGQGYRRVLDKELAKKSLEITPILEIGRTDIIVSMIAQNNMISFLPDFVSRPLVDAGKLCYLDVCDMHIDIWKQLIYHKNKWLSGSLKAVINFIKTHEFSK